MCIDIDRQRFHEDITVAVPPCRLNLPAKVSGKARQELEDALQAKFVALWNEHFEQAFDEAEACADPEKEHVLWNAACETSSSVLLGQLGSGAP